jgi:hypothetical protein
MIRIGAQNTRDNLYKRKQETRRRRWRLKSRKHPVSEPASCWLIGGRRPHYSVNNGCEPVSAFLSVVATDPESEKVENKYRSGGIFKKKSVAV